MIRVEHKGNFDHVEGFFKRIKAKALYNKLSKYGEMGVEVLSMATPVDTGITAAAWYYEIRDDNGLVSIYWKNGSVTKTGIPIVILLQYGHGTRNGGYVKGRDFINPAIQPIFNEIAEHVWKELTKL